MHDKKQAAQILSTLDQTANAVDDLAKRGKVDPRLAAQLTRNLDTFADRYQAQVFGEENLKAFQERQAKVIKQDSDEPYMKTFDNPQKPIKVDSDEPYMHKAPGGYNSKDIPTYDDDKSSSVSNRDEYEVRDLSEWADKTTKQPSWPGGSSGKSTRQGTTAPKSWSR